MFSNAGITNVFMISLKEFQTKQAVKGCLMYLGEITGTCRISESECTPFHVGVGSG